MAITSINTIQSNIDNEYLLQSLANLGQRFGVAGDSVNYGYFTAAELLNIADDEYANCIGAITISDNNIVLAKCNKSTLSIDTSYVVELSSILRGIKTTSAITVSDTANTQGVVYYGNSAYNGYIINLTYHYITSFFGFDTNNNIIEYNCIKINKETGILQSGIRITKTSSGKTIAFYINNTGTIQTPIYEAQIGSSSTSFSNICDIIKYLLNILNDDVYTQLSPDYIKTNTKNYFVYEYIFDINYNTDSSQYFSIKTAYDAVTYTTTYEKLVSEGIVESKAKKSAKTASIWYSAVDYPIYTLLTYFAYDLGEFYPYVKQYYSEYRYKSVDSQNQTNLSLKREILGALYNSIIANNYDNLYDSSSVITTVYVPLDFKFEYTYNSNEQWQLYNNANNISVEYIENLSADDINDSSLFCDTHKATRIAIYRFSVNYEDINNVKVVTSCEAACQYTLPYILNNYWVINNIPTSIKAKGEDAGNPNIIIVYSKCKDENQDPYEILSGANKDDVLDILTWTKQLISIEKPQPINLETNATVVTDIDNVRIYNWVPDLSNLDTSNEDDVEILNKLENALIINIASINCVEYDNDVSAYNMADIEDIYGEYGTITSFWAFNSTSNSFVCIETPSNYSTVSNVALDLSKMANFSNLIKWNLENAEFKHPDRYKHTYLVFDASYITLKNSVTDGQTYIYGNIRNNKADYYKTSKNINYGNDFNLSIQYNDVVNDAANDNITSVTQKAGVRYAQIYNTADTTTTNLVTNSLYTYGEGIVNNYFNEFVPNYNVPTLDLGEILVRNSNTLNKVNILSVDKTGIIYNSYIGSSYMTENKSIFTIGSSPTNVNIGTDTMCFKEDISNFKPQNTISIEFDNTYITSYTYVGNTATINGDIMTTGKCVNIIQASNTQTVNEIHYTPVGRYIYEQTDPFYADKTHVSVQVQNFGDPTKFQCRVYNKVENSSGTSIKYVASWFITDTYNELMNYCLTRNKIWLPLTIRDPKYTEKGKTYQVDTEGSYHNIYFADGLIIPILIHQLGLGKYVHNYEVTSDTSEIISCDGKQVILVMHSTNLYPKFLYNKLNSELELASPNGRIFIGNSLTIVYYISSEKLIMTIDEVVKTPILELPYQYVTDYALTATELI